MNEPIPRARSEYDKKVRKATLLLAAEDLALERGVREVTLTAVTKRVGLHPSALRRYFESCEELLLQLAEDGWGEWRKALLAGLGDARGLAPEEIARVVSGSLEELPLFCDLLTHAVLSLEGAVRIERARQYKLAATEAYDAMTDALVATSDLDRQGAQTLLSTAMSCGAYLFQLSRPSDTLRRLYEEEPRWAHDALRFREQLTEMLTAVARGARAS
ncbi:TetR/AcrR family transcriptional regulator [Amycolatopsis acidicola]|uniref:TetR/AcrR family transcriptional regulator n=1 Tax=Amycolatopsis acidicola TaxID=2596893 RepID=A0A5N0UVL8_9PSEU|nr:TetR family transcriptional regulator [Amycolatopsis acidicola]KAA9156967.1 TetR/AcrR family transcriptional regulator [Amycolatopsis acidicola]